MASKIYKDVVIPEDYEANDAEPCVMGGKKGYTRRQRAKLLTISKYLKKGQQMHSKFYSELHVEVLDDGRKRKLVKDLIYYSKLLNQIIVVPKGFITDFASVPRIFWNILPPSGRYTKAAVLHDYLYQTHLINKETADNIFKEAMECLGVSKFKIWSMYGAVKFFGASSYEK